eukprot:gene4068-4449_t
MLFRRSTLLLLSNRNLIRSRSWKLNHISSISTLLKRLSLPERRDEIALICDSHQDFPSDQTAGKVVLTYGELDRRSSILAKKFLELPETPIGAFTKPSLAFVTTMLAAWKANRAFVPLSNNHSMHEINYFIENSKLSTIICPSKEDLPKHVEGLLAPVLETKALLANPHGDHQSLNVEHDPSNPALIVYTSGTTGRPKGVVHSQGNLDAQITSLVEAWQYDEKDRILHFLPLYHMHGLLNKLLCMLHAGGTVQFLQSASAAALWQTLAQEKSNPISFLSNKPLTLFMGVPTIYARLLEYVPKLPEQEKEAAISILRSLRLMVSGSAALPDTILHQWQALTGHTLLERYGMTELGMALSNPYQGRRKVGAVGLPLREVQCRLVDDVHHTVIDVPNHPGELQVRGPSVFQEYLGNEKATTEAFSEDRWFRTGDMALVDEEGYYRILGRASSDIIKSSGYKISALEIERELLSFPKIREAAVVAVADPIVGEKIVAVISPAVHGLAQEEIENFLMDRLAHYKRPKTYFFSEYIPRNHMGKVNKKTLLKDLHFA